MNGTKIKKPQKKQFIVSIFCLLMCIAMFMGSTFAWFTDTASTSVNKIQAGTLNVKLEKFNGSGWIDAENTTLNFIQADENGNKTETENIYWEPGATYELPQLRISNEGNLALKYKIVISGINGKNAVLNKVIDWTITNDANTSSDVLSTEYTLTAKGGDNNSDILTIKGKMNENAGNEYQGKTITGISVTVIATQLNSEFDSATNNYDKNAVYPVYTVADVTTKTGGDDNSKTLIDAAVDIKTTEMVSVDGTDQPVATANIPTNVVLNTGTTQVNLIIKEGENDNIKIESADKEKKTLEIKIEGVSSDNNVPTTVSTYIEKGLTSLVVYHNETVMTSANSETALNDGEYYYDVKTGKFTIKTCTFSPFTYVYDAKGTKTVKTQDEFVMALKDATVDTIILGDDITIDSSTYDVNKRLNVENNNLTIDLNEKTFTAANCALTIKGDNVTIKNGKMVASNNGSYVMQVKGKNTVIDGLITTGGINVSGSNSTDTVKPDATATITNCNITGVGYYAVCAQRNSAVTIETSTLTAGSKAFFWAETVGYSEGGDEKANVDAKILYQTSTVTLMDKDNHNLYNDVGVAPIEY